MDDSEISGISFSAHISPSDLESTLNQTIPKDDDVGLEIKAMIFHKHHFQVKCFNNWKNIIKKQKESNIKELTVIQNRNKKIIIKYFLQWQTQYNNFERLFEIGCKVQISYHFILWKNFSDKESKMRQLFLQFLLNRRAIYEKTFFEEWKYSCTLEKRAKSMIKQQDKVLLRIAFNSLKINKINAQNIIIRAQNVKNIHEYYQEKITWNKWRYMYRLMKIESQYQRKNKKLIQERYFSIWIESRFKRIKRQQNSNKIYKLRKRHLLSNHFIKWIEQYNAHIEILRKGRKVARKTRKIFYEKYFYIWISKFNSSNYLTVSRETIETLHKAIILRRYFIEWHIKYSEIAIRQNSLKNAEQNFLSWKLNRTFLQWRSTFYTERVSRLKQRRMRKRILNAKVKRAYTKWYSAFILKRRERCSNKSAANFQNLSLMLKAFNRLKINADERKQKREIINRALSFHNEQLLYKSFIGWKNEHRRISRICFLVTSVLESWSESRKRSVLQQWISYANYRKEKQLKYDLAAKDFKARAFTMAMTSFVIGSNIAAPQKVSSHIFEKEKKFEQDSYDTLQSDVLISSNSEDEIIQPKRPIYL